MMQIKIEKTIIDEETFIPTLILKVAFDAEEITNLIKENGRDEASQIIGELFFDKLEKQL